MDQNLNFEHLIPTHYFPYQAWVRESKMLLKIVFVKLFGITEYCLLLFANTVAAFIPSVLPISLNLLTLL